MKISILTFRVELNWKLKMPCGEINFNFLFKLNFFHPCLPFFQSRKWGVPKNRSGGVVGWKAQDFYIGAILCSTKGVSNANVLFIEVQ